MGSRKVKTFIFFTLALAWGYYIGEEISGTYKHCFYTLPDGTYTITINSTDLCPSEINIKEI